MRSWISHRVALVAVVGAAAGAANELAIVVASIYQLALFAGVWVVAAAWVGRRASSAREAAVASAAFLTAMVCAFYIAVLVAESQLRGQLWMFWLLVSVVGGPLLGWAGYLTRRATGARAGFAAAGIAGLLAAEGVGLLVAFGSHGRLLFAVFDILTALVVLLGWTSRGGRRVAIAVFVPALLVGAMVFATIPIVAYGHTPETLKQHVGP